MDVSASTLAGFRIDGSAAMTLDRSGGPESIIVVDVRTGQPARLFAGGPFVRLALSAKSADSVGAVIVIEPRSPTSRSARSRFCLARIFTAVGIFFGRVALHQARDGAR